MVENQHPITQGFEHPEVPEALTSIASIRPLKFRYCLVANTTSPCASGLTKTPPGIQLITSVHRPMN